MDRPWSKTHFINPKTAACLDAMLFDLIGLRDNRPAAVHESGHAVAASAMGMTLHHARARPGFNQEWKPTAGGVVLTIDKQSVLELASQRETYALPWIVQALCGPQAETLIIGQQMPGGVADLDYQDAWSYAEAATLTLEAAASLVEKASSLAASLVELNRPAIDDLAGVLQFISLNKDQLRKILGRHDLVLPDPSLMLTDDVQALMLDDAAND